MAFYFYRDYVKIVFIVEFLFCFYILSTEITNPLLVLFLKVPPNEQKLLTITEHMHSRSCLVGFSLLNCYILLCIIFTPIVFILIPFLLKIGLSVLLQITASDWHLFASKKHVLYIFTISYTFNECTCKRLSQIRVVCIKSDVNVFIRRGHKQLAIIYYTAQFILVPPIYQSCHWIKYFENFEDKCFQLLHKSYLTRGYIGIWGSRCLMVEAGNITTLTVCP